MIHFPEGDPEKIKSCLKRINLPLPLAKCSFLHVCIWIPLLTHVEINIVGNWGEGNSIWNISICYFITI